MVDLDDILSTSPIQLPRERAHLNLPTLMPQSQDRWQCDFSGDLRLTDALSCK